MRVVVPPSFFKEIQERRKSPLKEQELFKTIIREIKEAEKTPLVLLPELFLSCCELPTLNFKEAIEVLEGNPLENTSKNLIPIACPGFIYQNRWDYISYTIELFHIGLIAELLIKYSFEKAILISSPYLLAEEEIGDFLLQTSIFHSKKGSLNVFILSKEKIRNFLTPKIPLSSKEFLGLAIIEKKDLPIEILIKELPCWLIASPLANNTPEKSPIGDKKLIKVGMSELRSNFVTFEDLLEGQEITNEDEKKKVWSIIYKRERREKEKVPYLRKGDILIPIKRKGNPNVAVIYDDLPPAPLFIPKPGLVIIRANKDRLSFKEVLVLSKILLAEFRRLSSENFLSVSDLKAILVELFADGTFSSSLKEGDEEKAFKEGRRALKEAVRKYLSKKTKFETTNS